MVLPPQTIISLPVQTAVCAYRRSGTFNSVVAIQASVVGLYRPPVSVISNPTSAPPHTIIWLPVHTAVCRPLPPGAWVVLVGAQISVLGLYRPPVLK